MPRREARHGLEAYGHFHDGRDGGISSIASCANRILMRGLRLHSTVIHLRPILTIRPYANPRMKASVYGAILTISPIIMAIFLPWFGAAPCLARRAIGSSQCNPNDARAARRVRYVSRETCRRASACNGLRCSESGHIPFCLRRIWRESTPVSFWPDASEGIDPLSCQSFAFNSSKRRVSRKPHHRARPGTRVQLAWPLRRSK